jgi:hypothetical protein
VTFAYSGDTQWTRRWPKRRGRRRLADAELPAAYDGMAVAL